MKIKDNISEEIPGMSRKIPFVVPDDYFKELPSRIMQRISASHSIHVPRYYPARRVLAYAAMFIGLVTIGYFGLRTLRNGQDTGTLTGEDVSTAIEFYGYEFDDDMLIAAITESDIDLEPSTADNETDVIIEYLSSEEIDLNELISEY